MEGALGQATPPAGEGASSGVSRLTQPPGLVLADQNVELEAGQTVMVSRPSSCRPTICELTDDLSDAAAQQAAEDLRIL